MHKQYMLRIPCQYQATIVDVMVIGRRNATCCVVVGIGQGYGYHDAVYVADWGRCSNLVVGYLLCRYLLWTPPAIRHGTYWLYGVILQCFSTYSCYIIYKAGYIEHPLNGDRARHLVCLCSILHECQTVIVHIHRKWKDVYLMVTFRRWRHHCNRRQCAAVGCRDWVKTSACYFYR